MQIRFHHADFCALSEVYQTPFDIIICMDNALPHRLTITKEALQLHKFECCYRATRRKELTELLLADGCSAVQWLMPEESGFYQPIVVARK